MEMMVHGFSLSEIGLLYQFLCVYEDKMANISTQKLLEEKWPKLKKLKDSMSSFTCNKCTKESLQVIGLVPMNNLVSMTMSKSSKLLSLLHHLRNSIAHGLIKQDGDYIHLIDYNVNNSIKVFSARGMIKSETLFEIIHNINNNIKLS